ncbi:RNA polymerase subunit sigma-70 [Plantactinospora sp. S1510]|uniref:RNA polymerase subunit sigma-70 n=1 Tax=Plantactinospora alkalitolerans TaxID=2789879 RepID=A0ABS0GPK2_9ACTN|nr:RNA polymerase subunit sigma-70 [Plantactinospora alkalitolerans]MBF9128126.1 RNA polymerase subunit sigma-70 [Plantactinospora alkalitolerans]
MTEVLLARARAGDDRAFQELVEPYRRELHLHCYRLLGSLTDAEDMLQEALLAAWRGLADFEGRASIRTWLYRIATNRCLNAIRDGARRIPPSPVPPFPPPEPTRRSETTWLQPYPDALLDRVPDQGPGPETRYALQESVELAFMAGLQRLPPRQAATLVLRDVLGYSAAEVAGMLDTTETAVKGALQRARATLDRSLSTGHRVAAGSSQEQELSRRFAAAFVARDLEGLLGLLTDDVWLAMPPAPHEYHGPAAVASFLRASGAWRGQRRLLLVPTRANRQPAYGCYHAEPGEQVGRPAGIMVLTIVGAGIGGMTRFLDNRLFDRFGLPSLARTGEYAPSRPA